MNKKDYWKLIKKPIIALAPMEGYTNSAFRRICKLLNPDIHTFTEFTSADGINYDSNKSKSKFSFSEEEQPLIAQIVGKNIDAFVKAAKFCEDNGFTGIDINMGCPVKKVFKSEHGVALRKNPAHAFKLVEAVAKNSKLPVSVKTRLGLLNSEDLNDFCAGLENSGADLVTIHGRTYKEMYSGPGNLEPIYALKERLGIPVIGNGGIETLEDGFTKLKNLDGFMIGRAAIGNPWLFAPKEKRPKNFAEKLPLIKLHAKYLVELKGERIATLEIRSHLLFYIREMQGAKKYRVRLTQVKTLNEIEALLEEIASSSEGTKPNLDLKLDLKDFHSTELKD